MHHSQCIVQSAAYTSAFPALAVLENAPLLACGAPSFEWPAGSGYCWYPRSSGGSLQGPGPNLFNTSNVAVTASGALQLMIQ
jgi:hypothetical protein